MYETIFLGKIALYRIKRIKKCENPISSYILHQSLFSFSIKVFTVFILNGKYLLIGT